MPALLFRLKPGANFFVLPNENTKPFFEFSAVPRGKAGRFDIDLAAALTETATDHARMRSVAGLRKDVHRVIAGRIDSNLCAFVGNAVVLVLDQSRKLLVDIFR